MPFCDVLFFVYEGLTVRHLSCFGGKGACTPAFDYLANQGFTHLLRDSSTRPEILLPSLLTARSPISLGLYPEKPGEEAGLVRHPAITLVDVMQEHGYRVIARNWEGSDPGHVLPRWTRRPLQPDHTGQILQFIEEDPYQNLMFLDRNGAISWHADQGHDIGEVLQQEERRLYQLIDGLRSRQRLDRTTIVIMGTLATKTLSLRDHDQLLPLIILPARRPGLDDIPREMRSGTTLDVVPTLMASLKIPFPEDVDGTPLWTQPEKPQKPSILYNPSLIMIRNGSRRPRAYGGSDGRFTIERKSDCTLLGVENRELMQIPNPDYHILERTTFVLSAMRSGSTFMARFFSREEFAEAMACPHHNWPNWERANLLHGAQLMTSSEVIEELLTMKTEISQYDKPAICSVSHDCTYIASIIGRIFPNARIIYISRDGRNQIRSRLSFQGFFVDPRMSMQRYPNWRDTPAPGYDADQWRKLDPFQRCVIVWDRVNTAMHRDITALGPRGLWVRFEDIFDEGRDYPGMRAIADFLADRVTIPTDKAWLQPIMTRKINADYHHFPAYKDWSKAQKTFFRKNAGTTMKKLGYTEDLTLEI